MTNSLNAPLARLIAGHVCLHACMAGIRMASPLPPPDVIAQEILDDLEAALAQLRLIAGDLQAS